MNRIEKANWEINGHTKVSEVNVEERYSSIKSKIKDLKTTRNSPQNAGYAQLFINASRPLYTDEGELVEGVTASEFIHICGESDVITAIDRGLLQHGASLYEVTEVDYDVHEAKKRQLNQKGRASKWTWVKPNSKEEAIDIIKANKQKLCEIDTH